MDSEKCAEVSVEIGEYLARTMTRPVDAEKVLRDDITLTVGLTYSIDEERQLISVYKAYGSAPGNGLYYASDKEFYYANPMVFDPIYQTPTSTSWSYTTDSTPGAYLGDLPPYALLDCRITVGGMEGSYRDVSVICKAEFP